MIELKLKLMEMEVWLLERNDPFYRVNLHKPEGEVDPWWIAKGEWDVPTTMERIREYFKNTYHK